MIIVSKSLDIRVALYNILGVNYHFAVLFPIGHFYYEVKDKKVLLNPLSFTSLSSYCH